MPNCGQYLDTFTQNHSLSGQLTEVVIKKGFCAVGISQAEAKALAEKATIFGYPLVLMDVTRRVATAVPRLTPER